MRGKSSDLPLSRGLTTLLKDQPSREVSERRQVGDAESMVNEGSLSGYGGNLDEEHV